MNRIVISKLTNPFLNLAYESYLFDTLAPSTHLLFLYTNAPCIVIGRNQNPWKECNLVAARNLHVPIIRRRSGGGTVVHDTGNVNFCVQSPRSAFSRTKHIEMIVQELRSYGLRVNDRHDILNSKGEKVSGSSFKIVRDKAYHHATMLLESDLQTLKSLLRRPSEAGIITGLGTDSVRSPVANAAIPPSVYLEAWIKSFKREYNPTNIEYVDSVPEAVALDAESLKEWSWNFGQTPKFRHQLGPYEFDVHQGKVVEGNFKGQEYRNLDIGGWSKYI